MNDCIVAIATPPINSIHHIIRGSGEDALILLEKVKSAMQNTEYYTYTFKKPHSYTGENMFEIHLWGNYIQAHKILQILIANGARMAKEGEFTRIAFSNGKKNFIELEQLGMLFESESADIVKINTNILESKHTENILKEIYNTLLNIVSELEATWDFVEHDIPPIDTTKLLTDLKNTYCDLNATLQNLNPYSFTHSYKIALWGLPNVGKSLIFKRLTGYDSLVTDIKGTTRDVISARKIYNNVTFTFLDLPGYSITFKNEIEKYSQELINNILPATDGIIYVFDLSNEEVEQEWQCFEKIRNKVILCIGNKVDVQNHKKYNFLLKNINKDSLVVTSALKNRGFGQLLNKLSSKLIQKNHLPSLNIVSSRQFQLLQEIKKSIENAISGFENKTSYDLIVDELKYSLQNLDSLFGKRLDEEILTNIMSKFCIGK